MNRRRSETISFRLPPELDADLQQAATAAGVSKHEYARRLVHHALRHDDTAAQLDRDDELKRVLRATRSDIAMVAKTMLLLAKQPKESVDRWLNDNGFSEIRGAD